MPKRPRRPLRPPAHSFRPLQTLLQILTLQAAYYTTALLLLLFSATVAGDRDPFMLADVLSAKGVVGGNVMGWTRGFVWVWVGAFMIPLQTYTHGRSKLVLDFSLTIHFIHLIIVSLFDGSLPTELFWWGVQAASVLVMVAGTTWLCRWRELRPIPFGGRAEEEGRGDGGVGGGGQGAYEMVQRQREEV